MAEEKKENKLFDSYERKSFEQVQMLILEFQNESLYRAYCDCTVVGDIFFMKAELWDEAKKLVLELYSQVSGYPQVWVMESYNLLRIKYMTLFTHIESLKERREAATKFAKKVFTIAALMVYHEVKHSSSMNDSITYKEPVEVLSLGYGWYGPGMTYYEYEIYKNLYSSIFAMIFDHNPEEQEIFYQEYKDKKEKGMIEYDYSYLEGHHVKVTDCIGEGEIEVAGPEWDGYKVFKEQKYAYLAKKAIENFSNEIREGYYWAAFVAAFDEKKMIKWSSAQEVYGNFTDLMNTWFADERKKCSSDTLNKWSLAINNNFSDSIREKAMENPNMRKGFNDVKSLYGRIVEYLGKK